MNPKERISVFIDGSNFYHSSNKILKINERINYQKLINLLVKKRELIKTYYYVANLDKSIDYDKYEKHRKFLEMLSEIPKFEVILCTLKKVKKKDGSYDFILKGDDIHLASDLVEGACKNKYDTAIIVSGDEDFVPSIRIVQKEGKKVENVYFRSSSSYKLRKICNSSIKLNKLISKIIDRKN